MTKKQQRRIGREWQAVLDDLWWAETFHWPPQVVDDMSHEDAWRLQFAATAVLEGRKQRKQQEEQARGRG
jgi:hypothetical protein